MIGIVAPVGRPTLACRQRNKGHQRVKRQVKNKFPCWISNKGVFDGGSLAN